MTVSLEKITPALLPELCDTLLQEHDPSTRKDQWQSVFAYNWETDEEYTGYVLVDGSRFVGVLGMIFSTRSVDGAAERFCNLHTWSVKEEYRGKSLLLMKPVLGLTEHTITDFTPTERVCELCKRLGFQQVSSKVRVLLPFAFGTGSRDYRITDDRQEMDETLCDVDRRIFHDHSDDQCGHLLVCNENGYCYAVYTIVDRYRIPYIYIHYLSNKDIFRELHVAIRSHLLRSRKARCIVVDTRQVAGVRLPFSVVLPARRQLHKSTRVSCDRIDSLYSEMAFLGLSVLSSLPDILPRPFRGKRAHALE